VLFAELGLAAERVTFDTLSGPLTVARGEGGYEMDFPAKPPKRIEPPAGLAEALGAEPLEVWAANFLVVVLADETAVRGLTPDVAALHRVTRPADLGRGNVGVAALADAGRGYDVVDRFFAPGSGIPEDPTTGSLHCILAPLFAEKLGRPRLSFHQAYPGRGGDLVCEARGERVALRGQALTVIESRLRLRP
jgi:predicted PhzF superfamily epimerase YddE/YHI9